jgi:hypothetical protein
MILGLIELSNKLRQMAREVPGVVAAAMYEEARIEMKEAQRRCPVKTGALKKSGLVYKPEISTKNEITVKLTFGVPTPYYAIYVHENLEAFHPNGEAKFLESTLLESAPYMAQRIAKRIDLDRYGK